MKKLTAFLLALTFLLGTLPLSVVSYAAADNTCGGEGNESNITWSFDSATGTLTISGTGEMKNWYHEMDLSIAGNYGFNVEDYLPSDMDYVYTPWYSLRSKILHAVVSDGITNVGDFAFGGCTKLKDVKLGKDIEVIGNCAFENCDSLVTPTLPDSVTDIGVGAFYSCDNLLSITLPEGVKNLGHGAFVFCKQMTGIDLPSSLETLGSFAFAMCYELASIEIPEKILGLGGYTFFNCTALTSVKLPREMQYINQHAFDYCTKLNNLTIPETVISIHETAFLSCRRLVNLYVFPGTYGETFCREHFVGTKYTINVLYHEWKFILKVHATCAQYGYTLEECINCGKQRENNVIPATGVHSFGSFTVTSQPDCVNDGAKERVCFVCGYKEVDIIPALGHLYANWTVVRETSCREAGLRTRECYFCKYVDEEQIPALPHTNVTTEVPPTCTEEGYISNVCSVCGNNERESIPKLPHTYSAVITPPTCEEEGYTTYTCSCGDTYTDDKVAALGHTVSSWKLTVGSTCTAEGTKTGACDRCGESQTESVPKLPHTYSTAVTPATCTEKGYTTYTCYCGETYTDNIVDALGHAMGEWKVTHSATCTEDGSKVGFCDRCGHSVTETIPKTGHAYVGVVTPATCTEEGYTTYTCHCGDSYESNKTAPFGHTMGDWVETLAPTCTAEGLRTSTCVRCNHSETETLPRIDHTYEAVVTPSTCTEGGYTTYTCTCGDFYVSDRTSPLGHTMGDWIESLAPTCTAEGMKASTCERCGYSETETLPRIDHTYEAVVTPSTCTEDGYTTYTCICGDTYESDRTSPLGHAMGDWVETLAPTCTEEGTKTSTCERCGYSETEAIDPLGHTYTAEVTPATCTEKGYTTYTCSCGDSYVADETDFGPHAFGLWTEVALGEESRTCKNCGHTETRDAIQALDVDGDGEVTEADVKLLVSLLVGNTAGDPLDHDLDRDGKLTVFDCVLLLQYLED